MSYDPDYWLVQQEDENLKNEILLGKEYEKVHICQAYSSHGDM